jgi:hypothetical protein
MPELARHLCIDGQADAANQRITDALGVQDTQPESGDDEDNDIEQAARNARSEAQSRADGQRNRSHHSRPWIFRPRPWTKPGSHGRIADGRGCRQDGRCAPSAVSRTATDGGRDHGRATDEVRAEPVAPA